MIYKKTCIILTVIAFVAFFATNFVVGVSLSTDDQIFGGIFEILLLVQKYSWPIVTIIFIYALYQFYVLGSKFVEKKFMGQKLMISLAIFMCIVQCLPLIYALFIYA